jgi:hypothetical protein
LWVLSWALGALFVCHAFGVVLGEIMQSLGDEQIRRYETENPVPVLPWVKGASDGAVKQSNSGGVSAGA